MVRPGLTVISTTIGSLRGGCGVGEGRGDKGRERQSSEDRLHDELHARTIVRYFL
jgi:hypothetical protein